MKTSFGIRKFKNAYKMRSKIWQMANNTDIKNKHLQKKKHKKANNLNKYRQKIALRLNKINRKSFVIS